MIQFPLRFKVQSKSDSNSWIGLTPNQAPISIDIPKEFDGNENGQSPESLFALSLLNCFIATFKVYAKRSNLEIGEIHAQAELLVDRDENKVVCMNEIFFEISVQTNNHEHLEKIKNLLERTPKNCMILNSVKTKTYFKFYVDPK